MGPMYLLVFATSYYASDNYMVFVLASVFHSVFALLAVNPVEELVLAVFSAAAVMLFLFLLGVPLMRVTRMTMSRFVLWRSRHTRNYRSAASSVTL